MHYVDRGIVWLTSLSSPLLVWAFLPFLRGRRDALYKCSTQRLAGICGRLDSDQDISEATARALIPIQPISSSSTFEIENDKRSEEADTPPQERKYPLELDRKAKE
jgi:hypothetical protein